MTVNDTEVGADKPQEIAKIDSWFAVHRLAKMAENSQKPTHKRRATPEFSAFCQIVKILMKIDGESESY